MNKEDLIKLKEKVLKLSEKEFNLVENDLPKKSAYEFLLECNKERLDCYALNYLGRKYTFKELFEKIDIVSKGLIDMGIKPEDKVAMGMLTTPEAIISFYSLNKIGATVYMVNATHEKSAIKEELRDSDAKVLLINDIFYDNDLKQFCDECGFEHVIASSLDDSFPVVFYSDRFKLKLVEMVKKIGNACDKDLRCIRWNDFLAKSQKLNVNVQSYYRRDLTAVISSTSGSTGFPKRPEMTNDNMNAMPVQMGMTCDAFAQNDSIFTTLPIWILYSLFNSIHEPLCLGVTVDLDPLFNSKKISDRLKQYRFNHWNTIPSYIEDMLKDNKMKNLALNYLKTITTGGDYRTPKLKQMAENLLNDNGSSCEIGQGYGLSELGGCFCYTYENNLPAESVGKPLVGNKFKIINLETGELCGVNEIGELYLYSPTLMKNYFKNVKETNESIVVDKDGIRWYRTQDTAHYDENGCLYLDGRLRRIEISRDSNGVPTKVFPDKVKQVISKHPLVDQCEIVMIPDDKRITIPIAYVVMKNGYDLNENIQLQIKKLCLENSVESYTIPTEIISISEIPRSASLKTDFNKLKEFYMESYDNKKNFSENIKKVLCKKFLKN